MKIGIIGGTFNPPHIGHLILGQEARQKLGLDKVWYIPANIPPHKQETFAPAQQRLRMLELAVAGNPYFEVKDFELQRRGISYTIDTMRELKQKYPQEKFVLIIGSDLANDFFSWKDPGQLQEMVEIVVTHPHCRPLTASSQFPVIEVTNIDISSTMIRGLIKKRLSVKYLVPDQVIAYIEENRLY